MSKTKILSRLVPGALLVLLAGNAGAILRTPLPLAPAVPPAAQAAQAGQNAALPPQALLTQYCVTCHNQQMKAGELTLDTMDVEHVDKNPAVWERVVRKVRTGMMPPSGVRRPERSVLDAFATELETRLDKAAALTPNPGAPALHRLNRTEYANAIRDLLGLDIDVATLLPADDSIEGFDNIADALGVSPSLIQGYVSAAMKISRKAVGDRTLTPAQITYNAPTGLSQDRHIEGLPLGTRGGFLVEHTFPLDAEYQINSGGGRGGPGGPDITIDGERIQVGRGGRIPVKAGPHTLGVAVVESRRQGGVDDAYSDFRVDSAFAVTGGAQNIVITGPYNPSGAGDTPSRQRIFVCRPANAGEEPSCARKIVTNLANQAFRGASLDDNELETYMQFYQQGRKLGDFEDGIQYALARVLIAPRFIFRLEDEPAGLAEGAVYRVSDLALAARLSFFLWSSIPDKELLDVATAGKLKDPAVLEQQVRRMLKDPKSDALVKNFAGQWLFLRELSAVQPDSPGFDENLRQSMRRETEMLFESVLREDRNIVDLLDSDYTFINERLARHYGIPNIRGDYFRRIKLDPSTHRRGLLGQASILTVTSIASRTSPVMRGKWVLQNILGTPPPVPPPGVETNLDADPKAAKPTTLRQRLELHRSNAVCASCHKIMDPIGFSLENFDLVGKWRDTDGGSPIDATGVLVDGTPLAGASDLQQALMGRSDTFVTSSTERLLTYALGRPLEYYDLPVVRSIVRGAKPDQNRFSALVMGIVKSAPFQTKIKRTQSTANN